MFLLTFEHSITLKVRHMNKFFAFITILAILASFTLQSCVTIREGEVGVKRKFGKYSDTGYTKGLKIYNPLFARIIKIPTRTENLEVGLNIPSKEGLNILSEVSILYNVNPRKAPELLRNIGENYEMSVILPVFRSAVTDISSNYFAKDMHTGERSNIENAIKDRMSSYLTEKGIEVEAVLLKSIQLPRSLSAAIEEKLEAEQQALRMQFVLQQAEREAEQKRIEAKGIRDAQQIIAEGLNKDIIQYMSIQALNDLAKSPNSKIIVTDGDMPILLDDQN